MNTACQYRLWMMDGGALLAGAVLTLAFAPFNIWPLAVLSLIGLLWTWENTTPARATWRGGLFGLGWFGFGIYWIFISLHEYGNAPAPFAILATGLVVLIMALYPALTGGLLVRWGPPPGPCRWLLAFPALWTVLDWLRSLLFTGFPWLALGYSQIDTPLGQLAPYTGVFGVGWATVWSAGLLWRAFKTPQLQERLLSLTLLGMLWSGAWGLGQITWVTPAGTPLRVAIVQGNLAQEVKWQPSVLETTLSHYIHLSLPEHGKQDVIIWPETATPIFYEDVRPFIEALAQRAQEDGIEYVTGLPTGSRTNGIFHNSVARIGHTVEFYHKHRLLPFGEYLPLRKVFSFFREWVTIPMADFTPGSAEQPLLRIGGQPAGVSICFEAVFGSDLRQALPAATWLINVSNDAWFKDSTAPHQHLQIARMRALELGRFMVRATNTGISAFIDDRGRLVTRGAQFQAEVIRGTVVPLQGTTPYARWGDWPIAALAAVVFLISLYLARRNRWVPHNDVLA